MRLAKLRQRRVLERSIHLQAICEHLGPLGRQILVCHDLASGCFEQFDVIIGWDQTARLHFARQPRMFCTREGAARDDVRECHQSTELQHPDDLRDELLLCGDMKPRFLADHSVEALVRKGHLGRVALNELNEGVESDPLGQPL